MGTQMENGIRHNPELIDLVFKLMFETVWFVPHDRRRDDPGFRDFERFARQLVGQFCAIDLRTADAKQLRLIHDTIEAVSDSVERLFCSGIISRAVYLRAQELVSAISEPLTTALAAPSEL